MLYQPKWSKAKQHLKSFTCESLKLRIDFHVINYRGAHDQLGRAVLTVDKVEKLSMCTIIAEREEYYKEQEIKTNTEEPEEGDIEHILRIQDQAHQSVKDEAIYAQYDFFWGLEQLFNVPIVELLKSTDSFILILCLIDRRVGKRTLRTMEAQMSHAHPIVQYFYQLRCEAENIHITIKKPVV